MRWINLFRHIDDSHKGSKYLTLVAPYIHDDTKLIFNVASIITVIQTKMLSLNSSAQTINEFIDCIKTENYFDIVRTNSRDFIINFKKQVNSITIL